MPHEQPPPDLKTAFREKLSAQEAEMITRLSAALRNAAVHDANNETWDPLIKGLRRALAALGRGDGAVLLELTDGQLCVNGSLTRPSFDQMGSFDYLASELTNRNLRGIRFATGSGATPTAAEVKAFAYALVELTDPAAYVNPDVLLEQRQISNIACLPSAGGPARLGTERRDWRTQAFYTFLMGISASREIHVSLRTGKSVGFKRAKRFVQSAVDLLTVDRPLMFAFTTIKNYLDYLYNHAVNSCFLSLLVGQRLGFDKRRLGDLGLATFLSDVGKATIPEELLAKQEHLSPEEWELLKFSRSWAVTRLLRFRGFSDGTLRQVLVAFEHGFTNKAEHNQFNLFSRIAEFATAFDAMTTSRPYRKRPMTPHEALTNLYEGDLLSKAFVHTLGVYPPGSLVLLDTREIGIVAEPPIQTASLDRPAVRLIAQSDGSEILRPPTVDTNQADERGRFLRTIVRAMDPVRYKINVPLRLIGAEGPGAPDSPLP